MPACYGTPPRLGTQGGSRSITRGACRALLPIRQISGSRQGRACHLFRGGRDVQHVRQTLSEVRAPIGDVKRGFPDDSARHVRLFHHDLLLEGQVRL
jgi:hypothetical protein